jgi:tetratricopeptide (TPR) repeat protein
MPARIFYLFCAVLALTAPASADFLDLAGPVQATALGGNLVALDNEPEAAFDNPAALAELSQYQLSASYEQMFAGLSGDNLGVQGLTLMAPGLGPGGMDLSWDHFGADLLQQDRIRLAYGLALQSDAARQPWFSIGVGASFLHQSYTLITPLAGVATNNLGGEAGSMDFGVALRPLKYFWLGGSVQDLNQPNLGVVGVDRLPSTFRWGAGLAYPDWRLEGTMSQSLNQGLLEDQAGLQWTYPGSSLAFRAGVNSEDASVGLGFALGTLLLDYAYSWSISAGPSGQLPGNQAVQVSVFWSNVSTDRRSWRELALAAVKQGHWGEAVLFFKRALDQEPLDPELKRDLADAENRSNEQLASTYFDYGRRAQSSGDLSVAVADFRWACHLNPLEKEYRDALMAAEDSLPQGPMADVRFQTRLLAVLAWMGRNQPRQALDELDRLRQTYPSDPSLLALESDLRAHLQRTPKAVGVNDETLREMEEALRYAGKGQVGMARKAWQKVLEKDPGNALAQQALRDISAAAVPLDDEKLRRAQDLFNQGLGAYQAGELRKAMDLWQQVLSINPGHLDAQNDLMRARIEIENGKSPQPSTH